MSFKKHNCGTRAWNRQRLGAALYAAVALAVLLSSCYSPLVTDQNASVSLVLPAIGAQDLDENQLEVRVFMYREGDVELVEGEPGVWSLSVNSGASTVPINGKPHYVQVHNDWNSSFWTNPEPWENPKSVKLDVPVGGPYIMRLLIRGGSTFDQEYVTHVPGFPSPPEMQSFFVRSGETTRLSEFRSLPIDET